MVENESEVMMTKGSLEVEYKDLSDNMRHYANMRFAQLTLYFGFSAGLVTVLFTLEPPLDDRLRLVFMIIGVIVSAAFGVMEERAATLWHGLRCRSKTVEDLLGYRQYTDRSYAACFSATNATRVIIWGGALLWLIAAILCICYN